MRNIDDGTKMMGDVMLKGKEGKVKGRCASEEVVDMVVQADGKGLSGVWTWDMVKE